MKYSIQKIDIGEDELILRYIDTNPDVESVIQYMSNRQKRLTGKVDNETVMFDPVELLYVETVDDKTFAYTKDRVIKLDLSLLRLEEILNDAKYFRCSKSMIVNISKVERLRSLPSNRIDAVMANGEHIIISRTYASDFRRLIRS